MKIKEFFITHPVFRFEEFGAYMSALGTDRPESWRQQLSYHRKVGNLVHIRKFLYAVNPVFSKEQSVDPYLLAGKISLDSILAYHTALELHGIAYTTFNKLMYLSKRQILPFSYEAQSFRSISPPRMLIKKDHAEFGIEEINHNGMKIKITSLERTMVDVLDRPDLGGGWEEIWRSLDNITQCNMDKLIQYALFLKNSTTIAKLGFFLEQRPHYLAPNEKYIKKLLTFVSKQAHYMDRDERTRGKYIERWKLMVPLSIINRTWEETNVENV